MSGNTKLTEADINYRLRSSGIRVIGQYKNTQSKALFKGECGHEFESLVKNVLKRKRCSVCNPPVIKYSTAQIQTMLEPRGIRLISEYTGARNEAEFECRCGYTWKVKNASTVFNSSGCPLCAGVARLDTRICSDSLANRGIKVLTPAVTSHGLSKFQCKCGYTWTATAGNVLGSRESGCPKCAGVIPLHISELEQVLSSRGIRPVTRSERNPKNVIFCCSKGHEWEARPSSVIAGNGCPSCAEWGFRYDLPARFYYLLVTSSVGNLWKIGITNRTVAERFKGSDLSKITVLADVKYRTGKHARSIERYLKKLYSQYAYTGPPVLKQNGNTELFTIDILQKYGGVAQPYESVLYTLTPSEERT